MLSVSGTGTPQFLLFSLPFSDRPIVLLVRDVVDIGVPIQPHASFPESPIFLLCIVFTPRACLMFVKDDSPPPRILHLLFPTFNSFPHKPST
jgi:hypothetical protein